jgi:hypothetical protein
MRADCGQGEQSLKRALNLATVAHERIRSYRQPGKAAVAKTRLDIPDELTLGASKLCAGRMM